MRFSTISAIHLLIAGIALGAPLDTLKCMSSCSLYSWNYLANLTQATVKLENAPLSTLKLLLPPLLLFPLQPRLLARMWR